MGATHLFRYPTDDDPAVLVRLDDREVVAFSQKCTHLGCVVFYEADENRWHCPCHEGNFDARTGAVLSGPPTRPLGRIDLEIRDDGAIWALGTGRMKVPTAARRAHLSALALYVIILVAFQVFLLTVAVEAFQTDDESLAWATAAVSVVLAAASAALLRYLRP